MFVLTKKEISSFFSSITGYLVVIVFLIINGLFIWVFPGEFNVFDSGYAQLDSLFILAPWVFLFLIPAVTMRLFSDEKKSGTIELLLTRPVSDFTIILSKYLAGLAIVVFALLPTLVYFLTVYLLASPVGNVDTGGIWGSYIGLFFLAAIYVSIGLFASSITENQIVSFITALLICFVFYFGFEALSGLPFLSQYDGTIIQLGINEHYRSVSRGVVDFRDVIYFLSVILFFQFLTHSVVLSRKWK